VTTDLIHLMGVARHTSAHCRRGTRSAHSALPASTHHNATGL